MTRSYDRDLGPIIDVHLHAYPPDATFPQELVNPLTGQPSPERDGEAHRHACLAEMRRLNIVTGS
jgi:uncharacterized protein